MGNKNTNGVSLDINPENTYKKNQELKMERWIQMHYQIKKREQALELAQQRELFYWLGSFYITTIIGSISVYRRMKNSMVFLPLLPLTFVMGYSADLAYGNKIQRIKAEAHMIMEHEPDLLLWPGGLPTVSSLDEARVEAEIEKKMHPHHV